MELLLVKKKKVKVALFAKLGKSSDYLGMSPEVMEITKILKN